MAKRKYVTLAGIRVRVGSFFYNYLKGFIKALKSFKTKVKKAARRSITMYDTITPSAIPANAKAVAGYVGGSWPTFDTLVKDFPDAHKLSIAVAASEEAECLDVESGDARPDQAPAWVKSAIARGVKKPVVYTSAAYLQDLVFRLSKSGLEHGRDYRIWSAHYTFKRHRCGPKCGFGIKVTADATQYNDKALGRNLDASVCSKSFFDVE